MAFSEMLFGLYRQNSMERVPRFPDICQRRELIIHHENDDTDFRVLTDEECIGVFATWLKKNGYNKKGIGIFLGPDPNLPVIKVEIIEDFDKGIT